MKFSFSFSSQAFWLLGACLLVACGGGGGGATLSLSSSGGTTTVDTSKPGAAALPANAQGVTCDAKALTCIEVGSTSTAAQATVPITFGQPLRAGDLLKGQTMSARDAAGNDVPLQMDALSTYSDGSGRFAVLSAQLANLAANEKRIVNLFVQNRSSASTAAAPKPGAYDLKLAATVYTPQVTRITFGNRSGVVAGDPFLVGETLVLQLGESAADTFALTITADLAGGSFSTLTKIAEAFMALINQGSSTYKAYKVGEGGGYENLWITTRSPSGQPFSIRVVYAGTARLTTTVQQGYVASRLYTAAIRPALDSAMASSGDTRRLAGAVASEYTVVAPFVETATGTKHPQLTARVHVRLLEGGQRIRSDMVIENNWTYDASPGNLVYDLAATQGGQTVLQQSAVAHNHHARWHKVIWWGGEPLAQVRHNMPYFLESRATWNYDLSLTIPESTLAREAANLAKADTGPMGPALITPYFPTTGGRSEIGPLPRWTALYLLTQDPRARASMLANADAAGAIPVHYRDSSTDQPVNLETHPGLALLFGSSTPADAPPAMANGDTIWSPDSAHQASFAYLPYLVTGDAFYLDEIMFWATWNMGAVNPGYREGGKGLINADQIRAQAWSLRSIGEAARALPDAHPMKAYFQRKLADNLTWYVQRYPRNTTANAVSPLGLMDRLDDPNTTPPWNDDFIALVMGQLAESGDPLALEFFNWIGGFTVGRFTHEAEGFCRAQGPAYLITVRDNAGTFIGTWNQLYKTNWPGVTGCDPNVAVDGTPSSPADYAVYARAMLAQATTLGYASAQDAFTWLSGKAQVGVSAMQGDPTWAIVPRSTTTSR